jgi:Protein of unknown function (DUF3631)
MHGASSTIAPEIAGQIDAGRALERDERKNHWEIAAPLLSKRCGVTSGLWQMAEAATAPARARSPPRHDDFQVFAGDNHRFVAGFVETPNQLDDVLRQSLPTGRFEGSECLQHFAIPEIVAATLLRDIRTVFQARGIDRIASAALVEALLGLDDGLWNEWRGPIDDRQPRKLTLGELSRLLRPFGIRPRTIWPAGRRPGDRSRRGYRRLDLRPLGLLLPIGRHTDTAEENHTVTTMIGR